MRHFWGPRIYGLILELLKKTDIETHLVASKSAEMTLFPKNWPRNVALSLRSIIRWRTSALRSRQARSRPWG